MRLPTMTAAPRSVANTSVSARTTAVDTIAPQSFLDSAWGFTKCATKCGVKSLTCLSCGTDLDCWLSCAGPKAVNCIADCI